MNPAAPTFEILAPARWVTPSRIGEAEQELLGADSLLLAQLLWNRGLRDAADAVDFLVPGRLLLADPTRMRGVPQATSRLLRAIAAGETVAVYGDYDVDGVAGAALLSQALARSGARVMVHIPDRARDGYGVTAQAVRQLAADGARVIITVDCGISANEEIALASELGTDVIVTDHHTVPALLPSAAAVLNPHQADCGYPFKDLAGGGVAFQLARALFDRILDANDAAVEAHRLTPYAALSTIADVVPLIGENRRIVVAGLEGIREGAVPGLQALAESARRGLATLSARDLAFSLIPRLNAASRMGDARDALELLVAPDANAAVDVAARLEAANTARRARMDELLAMATEEAADWIDEGAIVLSGEYPVGLAGLLAARMTDRFGMPCVVIEQSGEICRGSVRGVDGIHLVRALEACSESLLQFGGHARAAGFSLRTEQVDPFRTAFVAAIQRMRGDEEPGRVLHADCALNLESVGTRLADLLERFEPVGAGNPRPSFVTRGVRVRTADYVRGGHIRVRLAQGMAVRRGIAFRPCFPLPPPGSLVDVLYEVDRSVWAGQERVELLITDLRPATVPGVPAAV